MIYEKQERLTKKKKESAMFRLEYNLMEDIKGISESTEDTLSRTIRYLLRLGINVHNGKFTNLVPKKENNGTEEN